MNKAYPSPPFSRGLSALWVTLVLVAMLLVIHKIFPW